ncbi:5-dehydro-2-deoxygluconokinase [Geminicoccus roseus]|uniref:5-dehydro-2-deoxygluconokinase n=1 Tax=Geminicoccus roseus TaxID=404900 RepID=UPI001969C4E0|nr:5-dehydro-2-deoxygluconokinase [Geminicoccus roseus]
MALERLRLNRFLVLGRAGMDLYADPPGSQVEHAEQFFACLGGSAANIAAGIVRLGGQADLIGAVSDDAVGRFTRNQLHRFGVGTHHVATVGGERRNSLAVVETRIEDCQSVIYRNGAADFALDRATVEGADYADAGALIVTGTAFAAEPSRGAGFLAVDKARAAGVPVILDVDHRPYSWGSDAEAREVYRRLASRCDVVVGNDDEFAVMAGSRDGGLALAGDLVGSGSAISVYKLGERGSITFVAGSAFRTGIFPVQAIKPMGAGDAFLAGLVTGLANGRSARDSVRRGAAAAAIVVAGIGCAPAMPTRDQLDRFLADHGEHTPAPGGPDAHPTV